MLFINKNALIYSKKVLKRSFHWVRYHFYRESINTHSRSPSVKEGCRASREKRLTNDTPIFRKTSAMSCKLGTHTSNFSLLFSTTTDEQEE